MNSVEENKLSNGWYYDTIGNVIFENKKSKIKVKEASNLEDYPFFTSGKKVLTHNDYLVDSENIFMATGGVAQVKYFKGKSSYSTDTYCFTSKTNNLRFIFYFVKSIITLINQDYFKGVGLKHLQKKDFRNISIPIPPLEEQKRIVAKIDDLFAKIDKAISLTEESLVQAKNLLPSVLGEVFSGLSINNNLVELSDLCDFKNGFAFKSKDFNKVGKGVQVLRIGNVLDINKNPVYIEKKEAYRSYMLCENDIVISMTGTRLKKDYLFVGVIKNEPFYLNQRVGKISPKSFTNYSYIYFYLKSDMFRSEVFKYETGAVNQGNISGKAIMKMLIPKVGIDTQKEIANKCSDVSNQSKQTQSKLEEQLAYLKQLKSSILSKAFKGEL